MRGGGAALLIIHGEVFALIGHLVSWSQGKLENVRKRNAMFLFSNVICYLVKQTLYTSVWMEKSIPQLMFLHQRTVWYVHTWSKVHNWQMRQIYSWIRRKEISPNPNLIGLCVCAFVFAITLSNVRLKKILKHVDFHKVAALMRDENTFCFTSLGIRDITRYSVDCCYLLSDVCTGDFSPNTRRSARI